MLREDAPSMYDNEPWAKVIRGAGIHPYDAEAQARRVARHAAATMKRMLEEDPGADYQMAVQKWAVECFGQKHCDDRQERSWRFLEEALELAQAVGCTWGEAHNLVDYVFNRDKGDIHQEVGGVMTTLAVLCSAVHIDMIEAGYDELSRIHGKMEDIRQKQLAKRQSSPLPGVTPDGKAHDPE